MNDREWRLLEDRTPLESVNVEGIDIKAGLSSRGRCGDREDGCCIYFSKTISCYAT